MAWGAPGSLPSQFAVGFERDPPPSQQVMSLERTLSSSSGGSGVVLESWRLAPVLAPSTTWTPSYPLVDPSCHSHPQFQPFVSITSFALAVSWVLGVLLKTLSARHPLPFLPKRHLNFPLGNGPSHPQAVSFGRGWFQPQRKG